MKPTRSLRMIIETFTIMAICAALSVAWPQGTGHKSPEHRHAAAPGTAVPNPNCTLVVPPNPLSAAGLATPYVLLATDPAAGDCNEANSSQSAFVQAAILDPSTGEISIYAPLVIDHGSKPAVSPTIPVLPAGAIVAIWFGFDGNDLTLQAAGASRLDDAHCVNGIAGSVFSQYAYCNAGVFFQAANAAVHSAKLIVPPLRIAADGGRCPTTRDFFIVDQDQSDNLPTMYLATADGQTAQDTAANRALLPQASGLGNPSDNRLLDIYVDGAIGCTAWTAPDLADPGQSVPALALNELQARSFQPTPVALIPLGDPMAQVDGAASLVKLDAYRNGVDQPVVLGYLDADTARYCRQMLRIAPARLALNEATLTAAVSPDPEAGNSLYTFLAQRFVASYQILDCQALTHQADPVSVMFDAGGVAISGSVDQTQLTAILAALAPSKALDDVADSWARSR